MEDPDLSKTTDVSACADMTTPLRLSSLFMRPFTAWDDGYAGSDVRTGIGEDKWAQPYRWNAAAKEEGTRVPVLIVGDLFDPRVRKVCDMRGKVAYDVVGKLEWVPSTKLLSKHLQQGAAQVTSVDVRNRILHTVERTPNLIWYAVTQHLDKVADTMLRVPCSRCFGGPCDINCPERRFVHPNLSIGAQVETQSEVDAAIEAFQTFSASGLFLWVTGDRSGQMGKPLNFQKFAGNGDQVRRHVIVAGVGGESLAGLNTDISVRSMLKVPGDVCVCC